jgi:hypothetical protein
MAKDVKVYTGTAWESIKGPKGDDGVPGPTEVSADAGNASKLGTDGKIFTQAVTGATLSPAPVGGANNIGSNGTGVYRFQYSMADHIHPLEPPASGNIGGVKQGANVTIDANGTISVAEPGISQADADARYVELTGDTVRGELVVSPAVGPSHPSGSLRVIGDNTPAILSVQRSGGTASNLDMPQLQFNRTRGTVAAPEPSQVGDVLGRIIWRAGRAVTGGPQTSSFISCVCTRENVTGEVIVASEIRMSPAGFLANGTTLGQRTVQTLTTAGTTFVGEANTFQQGSVNSTAIGPLNIITANTNRTFIVTDAGKVIFGVPAANTDLTLTLPAAGTAGLVSGLVIEAVGNSQSPGKYVFVQAPAGVSLFYNSPTGGSGDGSLGGGVAARCRLRGPLTSMRLVCVNDALWWAFGDLVGA